jgi:pyrimidine operon attenuation protein/uracil phosphoribosyltransferase
LAVPFCCTRAMERGLLGVDWFRPRCSTRGHARGHAHVQDQWAGTHRKEQVVGIDDVLYNGGDPRTMKHAL